MVTLLSLCLLLGADDALTPEQAASITHANEKAQAEVSKKYGDKKAAELSNDERLQMARDRAAAEKAVLDKAGVSATDYFKAARNGDRQAKAERQAAQQKLEEKDKAEEAARNKKEEPGIKVQNGFSDENPVTLEDNPTPEGEVRIEKSIAPEDARDQMEAEGNEGAVSGGGAADDEKPAAKAKAKPGRRK